MLRSQTGHPVYDMFISIFIGGIFAYMIQTKANFKNIKKYICTFFNYKKSSILYNGRIFLTHGSGVDSVSENFIAICDWIIQNLEANNFNNAFHLKDVFIPRKIRNSMSLNR